MTDKELGTAAGEIFAKAFTLGYETGREYVPVGGRVLTAEQVEDVEALVATANPYSAPAARLRALFPATEPAAVRDGSDLVVVQRSHTAKAVQSWMTLDLWTDLGKNDKDFDAEYERQGFGDLWATLLGEVRALVQATTPAPAEPAEAHCTVPPEGWWCSRAANHDGPCAASEGVAPWVPQPLEADWLDQVDPRDPQSRTHRETAAAKFAEPAEEETKAEAAGERDALAMRLTGYGIPDLMAEGIATALLHDYQLKGSAFSPVVPAPTETGPWQDISEAPKHLTLIDRVGDKWTYDGDNWVTPETAILPVLYINRKYAPFVAAKEG